MSQNLARRASHWGVSSLPHRKQGEGFRGGERLGLWGPEQPSGLPGGKRKSICTGDISIHTLQRHFLTMWPADSSFLWNSSDEDTAAHTAEHSTAPQKQAESNHLQAVIGSRNCIIHFFFIQQHLSGTEAPSVWNFNLIVLEMRMLRPESIRHFPKSQGWRKADWEPDPQPPNALP